MAINKRHSQLITRHRRKAYGNGINWTMCTMHMQTGKPIWLFYCTWADNFSVLIWNALSQFANWPLIGDLNSLSRSSSVFDFAVNWTVMTLRKIVLHETNENFCKWKWMSIECEDRMNDTLFSWSSSSFCLSFFFRALEKLTNRWKCRSQEIHEIQLIQYNCSIMSVSQTET